MSLVNLYGGFAVPVCIGSDGQQNSHSTSVTTIDALNEACIMYGHVITSDGGSHTIDTTGSSALEFSVGTTTFANAGTTCRVGLAAVDLTNGPPGRAANASDVITFDVYRQMIGGTAGQFASNTMRSHVPTNGTKTIANGDLVAFAVQLTARGGTDSLQIRVQQASSGRMIPSCTSFLSAAYTGLESSPILFIRFSDGAYGWFYKCESFFGVASTIAYNSGSTPDEYGELFQFPFPVRVLGITGRARWQNNTDVVLYSNPLGSPPVAERTVAMDPNPLKANNVNLRFDALFTSPYDVPAATPFVCSLKPGASDISIVPVTLGHTDHRITLPCGANGYGVSRTNTSAAFADTSSGLTHHTVGPIISAFDLSRNIKLNDASVVG